MSGNSSSAKKPPDFARFVDGSAEVTVTVLEYRGREGEWYVETEQVVLEVRALPRTWLDRLRKRTRHEAVEITNRSQWRSRYGSVWRNVETGAQMLNWALMDAMKEAIWANMRVRVREGKSPWGGVIV